MSTESKTNKSLKITRLSFKNPLKETSKNPLKI